MVELELTRSNRLNIARAFRGLPRVDFSLDCAIEGQMGKAFVDQLPRPTAFAVTVGPFWYLAGDSRGPGGEDLLRQLPAYSLLMPPHDGWAGLAKTIFGEQLHAMPRYSFSAASLSAPQVSAILAESPYREHVVPLDRAIVQSLSELADSFFDASDFESLDDFLDRGLGFALLDGSTVMGAAYSSLVCSAGIEVSLYVEEPYRRKGVATALAGRLILECLDQGLRPNWDAANPESCKLAARLGFTYLGSYDAYYHTRS